MEEFADIQGSVYGQAIEPNLQVIGEKTMPQGKQKFKWLVSAAEPDCCSAEGGVVSLAANRCPFA
jgi:hypothetical protein